MIQAIKESEATFSRWIYTWHEDAHIKLPGEETALDGARYGNVTSGVKRLHDSEGHHQLRLLGTIRGPRALIDGKVAVARLQVREHGVKETGTGPLDRDLVVDVGDVTCEGYSCVRFNLQCVCRHNER